MAQQSNFSALCRGHLLPKEITNKNEVMKFMEAVDQFERIINDTKQIRITRMTEEEIVGTEEKGDCYLLSENYMKYNVFVFGERELSLYHKISFL